jgi:hypothetical protein
MAAKAVEDRFARHIGGGSRGFALGGFDASAPKFARHHSHVLNAIAVMRYLLDCCSER